MVNLHLIRDVRREELGDVEKSIANVFANM